jgi:acetylornithine deacetylase/succinyl-diaminopimelate desuccinylase-like protein
MAASDRFSIDVKGKGGHGAMPAGTVDAIVEAAALVTSLQTVISRNKVGTDRFFNLWEHECLTLRLVNCQSIRIPCKLACSLAVRSTADTPPT